MSKRETNKESVKEIIERYLEVYKMRDKLTAMDLEKAWPQIVGPSVARHTTEIKLQKNVLLLRFDSSIIKQELSFGKEKISKAVNEHFGKNIIQEVLLY